MTDFETVVVGAGPYGLSIGAHLRRAHLDHAVIGHPMGSWRDHMPAGMALKSERFASNLSDPEQAYTHERFAILRGHPYSPKGVPLQIGEFLDYAEWFQRNAVPQVYDFQIRRLRKTAGGFELRLDDRILLAKRVVLATGHLDFRHFPEALLHHARCTSELVSHSADHCNFASFAGREVVVIGCGQSGLETAALLHEQGANVRILARTAAVRWDSKVQAVKTAYQRVRWPAAGLGDGWRSLAYSEFPQVFSLLPERARRHIFETSYGPSGAWWLKERVAGKVPVLTNHDIVGAVEHNGKLRLSVRRQNESVIQVDADHVIAATGYKVDIRRLRFLDPVLRDAIETRGGAPVLNRAFESSVRNLHFVGLASAATFGPVMRFVFGTRHTASILSSHIGSSRTMSPNAGISTPAVSAKWMIADRNAQGLLFEKEMHDSTKSYSVNSNDG